MNDVMIDIETLGLTPDSVILSIAAVEFDRHTSEIGAESYFRIDPNQQNRRIDVGTLKWWLQQMSDVFNESFLGEYPLEYALHGLSIRVGQDCLVWSQGTDFDFPILCHAFFQHSIHVPWRYSNKRDTRTVYDVCKFDPRTIERKGEHHDALDDCHHQIRCVCAALNSIKTSCSKEN